MKKKMGFSSKLAIILLGGLLFSQSVEASTLQGVMEDYRILVPVRTISEDLGAKVNFYPENNSITIGYKDSKVEILAGSRSATVNGNQQQLQVAPRITNGIAYVPIRFIGEALGGQVDYLEDALTIHLQDKTKEWKLDIKPAEPTVVANTFSSGTKTVNGKKITYVTADLKDPRVKVKVGMANNTVTQAQPLNVLAAGAKASVNATYFAAYNGAIPMPDGTVIVDGQPMHITDIGSTIGFTSDNKVLIDFVRTRVQGYVNGEKSWLSYRINRASPDKNATIIYTPEYGMNVNIGSGWTSVLCMDGEVKKIDNRNRPVPSNGFVVVTTDPGRFKIGDAVSYETTYETTHTNPSDWKNVEYALSGGPSLRIKGQRTGHPKDESFTQANILRTSAQRTFVGINKNNVFMMGTVTATVSDLKDIVEKLGLTDAMCFDGGASSGLYYNGKYLTRPGRIINNSLNFFY